MVDWKLNFIIYFDLLSIRLFRSYDSGHGLYGLTQFTRVIFLNCIIQCWIDYELSFIFCFDLLSMMLSWTNDLGHKFDWLAQVDFDHFFIFFSWAFFFKKNHHSILGWLWIRVCNLIQFTSYMVIPISWFRS